MVKCYVRRVFLCLLLSTLLLGRVMVLVGLWLWSDKGMVRVGLW